MGALGEGLIGSVVVQIKGARAGERYRVAVTGIAHNRFTGLQQVACSYEQVGGGRTGACNVPP